MLLQVASDERGCSAGTAKSACSDPLCSRAAALSMGMADLEIGCERDGPVAASTAERLAALSDQARAQGHGERADRLLLLAWQAYDGQKISLVDADVAEGEHATSGAPISWELHRAA